MIGLIRDRTGRPKIDQLATAVLRCRKCPRLVKYLTAAKKKWPDHRCLPVPSWGNPDARIVLVGLAPGMHGANRTGRMFTFDSSGEWLYGMLHEMGLASRRVSEGPGDGLKLKVWIANAARCAPPQNRPSGTELDNCRPFLVRELALLRHARVLVALGRIAHDAVLKSQGLRPSSRSFAHGAVHRLEKYVLLDSYHPSRQNTNTGRLTRRMWRQIFKKAVNIGLKVV